MKSFKYSKLKGWNTYVFEALEVFVVDSSREREREVCTVEERGNEVKMSLIYI